MLILFLDHLTTALLAECDWPEIPANRELVTLPHLGTRTVVRRSWEEYKDNDSKVSPAVRVYLK